MIIYAHRGASEYAPENTFAAFYLGLEQGANGIETDVRITADGTLVLFHDKDLSRITGEKIRVEDITYMELYAKDIGSYKSKKYFNEKIVTLDDFLKYFSSKDISLAIELKSSGIEEKVVDLIYKYNCSKNSIITSFVFDHLTKIRSFDSDIQLGYLNKIERDNILDELVKNKINQYCPIIDMVTEELVIETHEKGMTLRTCCVYSLDKMYKAIACGVDGMTINYPDKLKEALEKLL